MSDDDNHSEDSEDESDDPLQDKPLEYYMQAGNALIANTPSGAGGKFYAALLSRLLPADPLTAPNKPRFRAVLAKFSIQDKDVNKRADQYYAVFEDWYPRALWERFLSQMERLVETYDKYNTARRAAGGGSGTSIPYGAVSLEELPAKLVKVLGCLDQWLDVFVLLLESVLSRTAERTVATTTPISSAVNMARMFVYERLIGPHSPLDMMARLVRLLRLASTMQSDLPAGARPELTVRATLQSIFSKNLYKIVWPLADTIGLTGKEYRTLLNARRLDDLDPPLPPLEDGNKLAVAYIEAQLNLVNDRPPTEYQLYAATQLRKERMFQELVRAVEDLMRSLPTKEERVTKLGAFLAVLRRGKTDSRYILAVEAVGEHLDQPTDTLDSQSSASASAGVVHSRRDLDAVRQMLRRPTTPAPGTSSSPSPPPMPLLQLSSPRPLAVSTPRASSASPAPAPAATPTSALTPSQPPPAELDRTKFRFQVSVRTQGVILACKFDDPQQLDLEQLPLQRLRDDYKGPDKYIGLGVTEEDDSKFRDFVENVPVLSMLVRMAVRHAVNSYELSRRSLVDGLEATKFPGTERRETAPDERIRDYGGGEPDFLFQQLEGKHSVRSAAAAASSSTASASAAGRRVLVGAEGNYDVPSQQVLREFHDVLHRLHVYYRDNLDKLAPLATQGNMRAQHAVYRLLGTLILVLEMEVVQYRSTYLTLRDRPDVDEKYYRLPFYNGAVLRVLLDTLLGDRVLAHLSQSSIWRHWLHQYGDQLIHAATTSFLCIDWLFVSSPRPEHPWLLWWYWHGGIAVDSAATDRWTRLVPKEDKRDIRPGSTHLDAEELRRLADQTTNAMDELAAVQSVRDAVRALGDAMPNVDLSAGADSLSAFVSRQELVQVLSCRLRLWRSEARDESAFVAEVMDAWTRSPAASGAAGRRNASATSTSTVPALTQLGVRVEGQRWDEHQKRWILALLLSHGRAFPPYLVTVAQVDRMMGVAEGAVRYVRQDYVKGVDHLLGLLLHQQLIACIMAGASKAVKWLYDNGAELETREVKAVRDAANPLLDSILSWTRNMNSRIETIEVALNAKPVAQPVPEELIDRLVRTYVSSGEDGFEREREPKALECMMRLLIESASKKQIEFTLDRMQYWLSDEGQQTITGEAPPPERLLPRLRRFTWKLLTNPMALPRPRPNFRTAQGRQRLELLKRFWYDRRLDLEHRFKLLDVNFTTRYLGRMVKGKDGREIDPEADPPEDPEEPLFNKNTGGYLSPLTDLDVWHRCVQWLGQRFNDHGSERERAWEAHNPTLQEWIEHYLQLAIIMLLMERPRTLHESFGNVLHVALLSGVTVASDNESAWFPGGTSMEMETILSAGHILLQREDAYNQVLGLLKKKQQQSSTPKPQPKPQPKRKKKKNKKKDGKDEKDVDMDMEPEPVASHAASTAVAVAAVVGDGDTPPDAWKAVVPALIDGKRIPPPPDGLGPPDLYHRWIREHMLHPLLSRCRQALASSPEDQAGSQHWNHRRTVRWILRSKWGGTTMLRFHADEWRDLLASSKVLLLHDRQLLEPAAAAVPEGKKQASGKATATASASASTSTSSTSPLVLSVDHAKKILADLSVRDIKSSSDEQPPAQVQRLQVQEWPWANFLVQEFTKALRTNKTYARTLLQYLWDDHTCGGDNHGVSLRSVQCVLELCNALNMTWCAANSGDLVDQDPVLWPPSRCADSKDLVKAERFFTHVKGGEPLLYDKSRRGSGMHMHTCTHTHMHMHLHTVLAREVKTSEANWNWGKDLDRDRLLTCILQAKRRRQQTLNGPRAPMPTVTLVDDFTDATAGHQMKLIMASQSQSTGQKPPSASVASASGLRALGRSTVVTKPVAVPSLRSGTALASGVSSGSGSGSASTSASASASTSTSASTNMAPSLGGLWGKSAFRRQVSAPPTFSFAPPPPAAAAPPAFVLAPPPVASVQEQNQLLQGLLQDVRSASVAVAPAPAPPADPLAAFYTPETLQQSNQYLQDLFGSSAPALSDSGGPAPMALGDDIPAPAAQPQIDPILAVAHLMPPSVPRA